MIADLIARLEKAEGPSPHLDAEIALAILYPGWVRHPHVGNECPDWVQREMWPSVEKFLAWRDHNEPVERAIAANYTASIDAALTLVPDGMWWLIGAGRIRQKEPLYGAQILRHDPDPPYTSDVIAEGEHDAGAAVALCIAALRAGPACLTP